MKNIPTKTVDIVKPLYFANWGDIWGFPIAYRILPYIAKMSFITPNVVTITSFILFIIGSLSLFVQYPFHLVTSTILLPLAFLGDDLDGQLARYTGRSSEIGDYLDKTFDVMKIFIITISLSIATYTHTHNSIYIFLGFIACFFFNYRYYLKLETIFHEVDKDSDYLVKSSEMRRIREEEITKKYKTLHKTFQGKIQLFWLKNRLFFLVDEAEFCIITAIAAASNKLEIGLILIAIAQVVIAIWRWIERGVQIHRNSPRLLWPMRK